MKFKYLIILLAVVSLFLLYALSLLSQPTIISLSTIASYEGKQVLVQGRVINYRSTTYGSQIIDITDPEPDNKSIITLFLEGNIPVEYGDMVQAIGMVQQYNTQWEVVVRNEQFLTIVQKWHNISCPLWQLAEHPERYCNLNIQVTGVVEKTSTGSLSLRDPEGRYELPVYYTPSSSLSLSKGEMVTVGARFLYEPASLRYVLRVTDPSHYITPRGGEP